MTDIEFQEFPKIARLQRECVITEKIDGTNAQVYVPEDDSAPLLAGSRNRWLTLESDNFGFAAWVAQNSDELRKLGPGRHYGEWWGAGIQRRYGLDHRRFSLFNVGRWCDEEGRPLASLPSCVHVVPVLYRGPFSTEAVRGELNKLSYNGSAASPGFMDPEGVCVWHEAARLLFKVTLDGDGHKGTKPRRKAA